VYDTFPTSAVLRYLINST